MDTYYEVPFMTPCGHINHFKSGLWFAIANSPGHSHQGRSLHNGGVTGQIITSGGGAHEDSTAQSDRSVYEMIDNTGELF